MNFQILLQSSPILIRHQLSRGFFSFTHSALAVQIGPCRITLIYGYFKRIIFIFCPNLAEPNLKYQFYLILPNFIKLNIENLA